VDAGVLYLQLADDLVLLKQVALQLLDLVEVVLNERQVLAVVQFVHLDLELRVVGLELLHQRYQDILFALQVVGLNLQLVPPLLLLLQLQVQHLVFALQDAHLQSYLLGLLALLGPVPLEQPLEVEAFALEQLLESGVFEGELFDALVEMVDVSGVRVAVDYWFVLDVHGLAGVLDGVETLLIVGLAGTDAGNHVGVGVAAEAVLQDAGEFGVAVGDELRLLLVDGQR